MARFLLFAASALALVGTVATASAQRSPDRSSELLDALARRLKICAEITDNGQRLACYDHIDGDIGSGAAAAPQPVRCRRPWRARPVAPPRRRSGGGQPLPPPPGASAPQPGDPRPLAPPPAAASEPQVFRDPPPAASTIRKRSASPTTSQCRRRIVPSIRGPRAAPRSAHRRAAGPSGRVRSRPGPAPSAPCPRYPVQTRACRSLHWRSRRCVSARKAAGCSS